MILYTIEKKKVGAGTQKTDKYYPKIVRGKTLDFEQLVTLIAERTTLEDSEVRAFVRAFSKAIRYYVTNSYVVEVEGLGIFTPCISAKSQPTEDRVTAKTVTRKSVRYAPTVKMDTKIQKISIKKTNLDTAHV